MAKVTERYGPKHIIPVRRRTMGLLSFATSIAFSNSETAPKTRQGVRIGHRYCCKSRKSNGTKNSAKVDFLTALPQQSPVAPMRWSVVVFV